MSAPPPPLLHIEGLETTFYTEDETVHAVRGLDLEIGMRSIVIIGNSTSKIYDDVFITQRGYKI